MSLSIPGSEYTSLLPGRAGHSTQGQAVLSSPSRSSSVEASPPKVVRCVDIKACRQHVLVAQRGDDTVQLTCRAEGKESGHCGSHPSAPTGRGQLSHSPEESSLRQQSENPKRTAKCRGNMSWIPRLQGEGMGSVWRGNGVSVGCPRILQPKEAEGGKSSSLPCSVSTIRHQSTN